MIKDIRKLNKDWQEAFPILKKIGANRFIILIGPLIAGIKLEKPSHGDSYAPYIFLNPTWNIYGLNGDFSSNLKERLQAPVIFERFLYSNIMYADHEKRFPSAVNEIKEKFLPLEGSIHINEIFTFIDSAMYFTGNGHSGARSQLLELKYLTSVYYKDSNRAALVLEEIMKASLLWDMVIFESWMGDFDVWIEKLKSIDSTMLRTAHQSILKDPKLKKVNSLEILS